MKRKKWFKSKTIWINIIGLTALFIQSQIGFIIDAETQVGILAVINLILRVVTGSALEA